MKKFSDKYWMNRCNVFEKKIEKIEKFKTALKELLEIDLFQEADIEYIISRNQREDTDI